MSEQLDKFRAQYPDFANIPDDKLVEGMYRNHKRNGGTMRLEEFQRSWGFTPLQPQLEMRNYDPSWRENVAGALGADELHHPQLTRVIEGSIGSKGPGTGHSSTSLADTLFFPVGAVFTGNEMYRSRKEVQQKQEMGTATFGDYARAFIEPLDLIAGGAIERNVIPAAKGFIGKLKEFANPPIKSAEKFYQARGGGLGFGESGAKNIAERRVAEAAQEDVAAARTAAGPKGFMPINPETIAAEDVENEFARRRAGGLARGQDYMLGDQGEATRSLARDAANKSPEAWGMIETATRERHVGQTERVLDWFRKQFNDPKSALANLEAAREAAKSPTSRLYSMAYDARIPRGSARNPNPGAGDRVGIETPGLLRMFGARRDRAGNYVRDTASNEQSEFFPLLQAAEQRMQTKSLAGTSGGIPSRNGLGEHTLAFWDTVKRLFDDRVGKAIAGGEKELARDLTAFRGRFMLYLDNMVPEYKQARGVAAQIFRAGDAFEAGQLAQGTTYGANHIAKVMAKMGPEEKRIFQAGYLYQKLQQLEKAKDARDIVPLIMQSRYEREKMQAIVGGPMAAEIQALVDVETAFTFFKGVLGNSTTARQAWRAGKPGILKDAGYGTVAGGVAAAATVATGTWWAALSGALLYGAARSSYTTEEQIAKHVARLLTSKEPSVYRRGIIELTRHPKMQDRLQQWVIDSARRAAVGAAETHALKQSLPGETPYKTLDLPKDEALKPGLWYGGPQGPVQSVPRQ